MLEANFLRLPFDEKTVLTALKMPKSKRAKVVQLTATAPHGRTRKSELVDAVRGALDSFRAVYVFTCDAARSNLLKNARASLRDSSRFFFGRNKVVKVALGRSPEEAYLPGLEKLSEKLVGEVGLLFTNLSHEELDSKLKAFEADSFARAGFVATEDVQVKAGPIEGQPSSMYEPLRKLQLPVRLSKGIVELEEDHYVCQKGDVLTPEQAQGLIFFNKRMAKFQIRLLHGWRDGELKDLDVELDEDDI